MLLSHYYEGIVEAGCDEAGRGCLAGSVFAAAVILPTDYQNALLNDSKQLSERRRYQLREQIERDAISWAVGVVTHEEIDSINILNASILAMHRALAQLSPQPEAIIVDGNRFKPYTPPTVPSTAAVSSAAACASSASSAAASAASFSVHGDSVAVAAPLPHTCIIKGDGKYLSIAAASILAKTYRDDYMLRLAEEYPQYGWQQNKGYPTPAHRDAIRRYGTTPYHRRSFALLPPQQLSLDF